MVVYPLFLNKYQKRLNKRAQNISVKDRSEQKMWKACACFVEQKFMGKFKYFILSVEIYSKTKKSHNSDFRSMECT